MGQPFTMMTGINYPLPAKCLYLKVFMNSYHSNANDTVIIVEATLMPMQDILRMCHSST